MKKSAINRKNRSLNLWIDDTFCANFSKQLRVLFVINIDRYTSSLVPYQDLKKQGLTLIIVETSHINCAVYAPSG